MKKIVIEELPPSSRRHPRFKFSPRRPSGKEVLKVEDISKSYDGEIVLKDVSLTLSRGDRVAVIGPNGIGKSTLLKIALGIIEPNDGETEWGYEAHPGYFSQDHEDLRCGENDTVLSWLWDQAATQSVGWIRSRLADVLFDQHDVDKKVRHLSGGESSRLVFAGLGVTGPNVLVLDEPTNHLDIEGIEALASSLNAFEGTIIFVSHNRWFVRQLATRIIELCPDGIEDYQGTYDEYLQHCGDDHLE
jgi:ATPase subunit of ABC transporter with duplicated ATPase domains